MRFAGAVYRTAHDREMQRLLYVSEPSFDLGDDLDKVVDIEAAARRTCDDGMIFKDGVPMRRVSGEDIVEEFVKEVEQLRKEGASAKSIADDKPLVQIT